MPNSNSPNPFNKFQAPAILKGGRSEGGDFVVVCTRCGKKLRINYQPNGQFSAGNFTCVNCQQEITSAGQAKEREDFRRVFSNPVNQDRIARAQDKKEKMGIGGQTTNDPIEAARQFRLEKERMKRQGELDKRGRNQRY